MANGLTVGISTGPSKVKPIIGQMKHRITFQEITQVPDGQGGFKAAPVNEFTVWGSVETYRGDMKWQGEQMQTSIMYRILVRWNTAIHSHMWATWNNRKLEVMSIVDVNAENVILELMCQELQADAT